MKSAYDFWAEELRKPEYWYEKLKSVFSNNFFRLMTEKNIGKAQLAKKIGVSKPYISKILRGDENFTVKTLAKVAFALGCEIDVNFRSMRQSAELKPTAEFLLETPASIPVPNRDTASSRKVWVGEGNISPSVMPCEPVLGKQEREAVEIAA
ncbi:MAG: helix-turn-helix transcriptional regulator [Synergistaceae bacterium]|jgi:transcriptional regulator with XRE-family HTH domain|nr:helix-turn-helix transcriptional regulator [Synergistaceae bacterium]